MIHRLPIRQLSSLTFLLILSITLLVGCGSSGLRNEAPQVKIDGMHVQERQILVEIGIRNINAQPMVVQRLESSLVMQGHTISEKFQIGPLEIPANGREVFPVRFTVPPDLAAAIGFKTSHRQGGLSYSMEGRIFRDGDRNLVVETEGRLYPVPGRPDRFR